MFALDLLCVPLARLVLVGIEMPGVRAPSIGVIAPDAKRLEQPFELQKHLILRPATDIRQDFARLVIKRMPQPALLVLLPHLGPHLIDFRFINSLDHHVYIIRMQGFEELLVHQAERRPFFFNVLMTVVGLIFNTRAVSRIPLPLRLISMICSLIAGARPL
jgi:hypothetical protein